MGKGRREKGEGRGGEGRGGEGRGGGRGRNEVEFMRWGLGYLVDTLCIHILS